MNLAKRSPSEELAAIFDERAQAVLKALPPNCGLSPARLAQFAIQAFKSDALRECTPMSVYEASLECATLGLIPGGSLGHGYLIPYNCKVKDNGVERWEKRAQFQLGYRGMVELLRRSGAVTQCEVRAVFEGDLFDYSFGLNPRLDHKPIAEPTADALTHAYAIARFRDGGAQFDVMTRAEILAIMARSKASGSGPWVTDPIEMAKKCPVRRLAKILPMSQELNDVLSRDDERTVDLSARVVVPTTFSPSRQLVSEAVAESAGVVEMAPSPVDDFAARIEKCESVEALGVIAKEIGEVGLSKDARLVAAWKARKAAIEGGART